MRSTRPARGAAGARIRPRSWGIRTHLFTAVVVFATLSLCRPTCVRANCLDNLLESWGNDTATSTLMCCEPEVPKTLPAALGTSTHAFAIRKILLASCSLTGALPSQVGLLSGLTHLSLAGNKLAGPIPRTLLTKLTHLEQLDLSDNLFNGTVVVNFEMLPNLRHMYLERNQLSGGVEVVGEGGLGRADTVGTRHSYRSSDVLRLDIPTQSLEAALAFLARGSLSNIKALHLGNTFTGGTIPPLISKFSLLTELDLRNNSLSSTLPSQLNLLKHLSILNIHGNMLLAPQEVPSSSSSSSALAVLDWVCDAGFFDASDPDEMSYVRASSRCVPCAPGTFQAYVGQRSCVPCGGQSYAPHSGSVACLPCNPGFVVDNHSKCQCPADMDATASTNESECQACEDGSVFDATLGRCLPCSASNSVWDATLRACRQCPPGFVTVPSDSKANSTTTTTTTTGASGTDGVVDSGGGVGGGGECVSPPGFLYLPHEQTSNEELRPCPAGARCPFPGTTVTSIVPREGYWRASETATTLYACPGGKDACPQVELQATPVGSQAQVADDGHVQGTGGDGVVVSSTRACAPTRSGAFCSECIDGYAKRRVGRYSGGSASATCELCNSRALGEDKRAFVGMAAMWLVLFFVLIVAAVLVVVYLESICSVCCCRGGGGRSASATDESHGPSSSSGGWWGSSSSRRLKRKRSGTGAGTGAGGVAELFVGKGMILLGYIQVRLSVRLSVCLSVRLCAFVDATAI
jgi:hypothetical protein